MTDAAQSEDTLKRRIGAGLDSARLLAPGIVICVTIAAAATFLSEHYGAPTMLMALLLGIAMNFLSATGPCVRGVEFASRTVLRTGVALLGLRITAGEIASLGWQTALLTTTAVALTIAASVFAARAMGFRKSFGVLTGGATASCGASAALAISQALPDDPDKQRTTLFTVIGVSTLSTIVMVVYPAIIAMLNMDDTQAGVFLGATIHDVAQVVGAGYSISDKAGETATIVKLMRVALLLPVVVAISLATRQARKDGERPPLLPWFAAAFLGLAMINSFNVVPEVVQSSGAMMSQWCLVTAIAALGVKTELKKLIEVGPKPILLMVGQTVFMALIVLAGMAALSAL
ncbi:MAG: putative sulfate exporter family transporter [Parvularculaceae bacterium]